MTSSSVVFPDPEGPVITSVSPAPTLRSAPPRMVRDPPPTYSSPGPTLGPDAAVSNGHGSGHRHRRRRVLGDDHQGGDQFPLTLEHEFYDQIPAGAVQLLVGSSSNSRTGAVAAAAAIAIRCCSPPDRLATVRRPIDSMPRNPS